MLKQAWAKSPLRLRALENRFSGRKIQQEIDLYRLWLLAETRAGLLRDGSLQQGLDASQARPVAFHDQLLRVQASVEEQIEPLLRHADDLPFRLILGQSSIGPAAGTGVFVQGSVMPGAVVAFHPGTVYFPYNMQEIPGFPNFTQDNCYTISRFDNLVFDAQHWHADPDCAAEHVTGREACTYAQGHMINHPPRGARPNVMPFAYNFPTSLPSEVYPRIPHRYHAQPVKLMGETGVVMHSLVLVATQTIADGEEVFLDYRFNPSVAHPAWYHPVDKGESERRWKS